MAAGATMTVIRPRKSRVIDTAAFLKAVEDGIQDTASEMIADFEKTTATWEHKPLFEILGKLSRVGNRVVEVTVGTTDEIYGYVSDGTKAHMIQPKAAPVLRFQGGFTAKTKPGRLLSSSGGSSGEAVFAKAVHHPGTKARKFNELIAKKHQTRGTLSKNVQARIEAVAAKG